MITKLMESNIMIQRADPKHSSTSSDYLPAADHGVGLQ